jgi:nitronate monooxygenase
MLARSNAWPDRRILELFGIEVPIIQAPMAGANSSAMAIAVSEAGGLGSLPCALLSVAQARDELRNIRSKTTRPINLNFFCHRVPRADSERENRWRARLQPYYVELGLDPDQSVPVAARAPFDDEFCELVLDLRPRVVSFHFGLPDKNLLLRVKDSGAKIISSATSVDEARWLEERGCDAIVAQGCEAGGHRGIFLSEDVSSQPGTMALVPQVVDAVKVPVIAAGGIADSRGIAAALALGASAVQIGTAYLLCPESTISPIHRQAIRSATDNHTTLTNVFTGRPARAIVNRFIRELGPLSDQVPEFPLASAAFAPLRQKAEALGSADFIPLWAGQAAHLAREVPAGDLTKTLAREAMERLANCHQS